MKLYVTHFGKPSNNTPVTLQRTNIWTVPEDGITVESMTAVTDSEGVAEFTLLANRQKRSKRAIGQFPWTEAIESGDSAIFDRGGKCPYGSPFNCHSLQSPICSDCKRAYVISDGQCKKED